MESTTFLLSPEIVKSINDEISNEIFKRKMIKIFKKKCLSLGLGTDRDELLLASRILKKANVNVHSKGIDDIYAFASIIMQNSDILNFIDYSDLIYMGCTITEVEKSVIISQAFSYIKQSMHETEWKALDGDTDLEKICNLLNDIEPNINI